MKNTVKKIDRPADADEIAEIKRDQERCDEGQRTTRPPEEWRTVGKGTEGGGWTLVKIDTLPDVYALLSTGDVMYLEGDEVAAQIGFDEAITIGVGPYVQTDGGQYRLIATVNDEGHGDHDVSLYVGRAADGHCDLIAIDNASCWLVGDADDKERNRDHWEIVNKHGLDMEAVRAIDEDLADWLEERRTEA